MSYTNNIIWQSRFFKLPSHASFDILPTIRYVETLSQGNDRYRGLCISWGRYGASLQFTILNPEVQKFEHEQQVVNVGGKDIVISSRVSYAMMKMYHSLNESDKKEFIEIGGVIDQIIERGQKQ